MKQEIIINGFRLDAEQMRPILNPTPYTFLVAGAGSGKTLTILGKVKYMLETKHYRPKEICCISFTNEAVRHLEQEIRKNTHQDVPCYTFHKLAMLILDQEQFEYQLIPSSFQEEVITDFLTNHFLENNDIVLELCRYYHLFGPWKKKRLQRKDFSDIKKLCSSFLATSHSQSFSKEDWLLKLKEHPHSLLLLFYAIQKFYERKKWELGAIDFDDMIWLATLHLKQKLPFRLVIIDEFQDTSFHRFQFIQKIIAHTGADLFVVGDDYQSIYRFSGCDVSLFLNFQSFFPKAQLYKLEQTYRNSMELVSLAGRFIQKNPYQIPKALYSAKHLDTPIKIVYASNIQTVLKKLIERIPKDASIFILGRHNFDLQRYSSKLYQDPTNRIRFLSIHKSKGLESDYVIVLNLERGEHGFPAIKENNVETLFSPREQYPLEEERRLFYVALTRARNEVFLITRRFHESIFIQEIKKEKEVKILSL